MSERENAIYELIDLASGNVIDDFDSVNDALESMRRVASSYGWPSVANLSLMRVEGEDQALIGMKENLAHAAQSLPSTTAAAQNLYRAVEVLTRGSMATVLQAGAIGVRLRNRYHVFSNLTAEWQVAAVTQTMTMNLNELPRAS